jgi:S-adenosylmethionine hydrolase
MEYYLMNRPIILLTDFGSKDPFVGIMKGVINRISPECVIIDLSHEIQPGDIRQGAVTLWQSIRYFAPGSIFLVVIDPGVGTKRRAIAAKFDEYTFIAPDNGVLSFVNDPNLRAWEISNPAFSLPNPGTTFHGRDIFAPAAAHAARGVELAKFGNPISDMQILPSPKLDLSEISKLVGETLFQDRFGNMLTSLGKFKWTKKNELDFRPWVGETDAFVTNMSSIEAELSDGTRLPFVHTFADIAPGACGILLGSSGLLEIAANRQSATNLLNLAPGEPVIVRLDKKQTRGV